MIPGVERWSPQKTAARSPAVFEIQNTTYGVVSDGGSGIGGGGVAVDTKQMLGMAQAELDALFRKSPPGDIPRGRGRGTVIAHPGTGFTVVAARIAHRLAWQGKVFDPDKGELRNQITPLGLKAVRAKVYKAPSWFDGNECVVLDYSKTSLVAHWIRDEMRLVAPGVYLGNVFWEKDRVLNFALEFPR